MVTIKEAAGKLGLSENTVRRRLHTGLLNGYQDDPPNGKWWVEVPEVVEDDRLGGEESQWVAFLRQELAGRDKQLEMKDEQIRELHVLLQQAQAALPAPKENRQSWWRFWQR